MGVLTKEQEKEWQEWINKIGRFLTHKERSAERAKWEKDYKARVGTVTHFVEDEEGKEVGISGKEYWLAVKAKEAAKPKRTPTKPTVTDPIVRKFEYINGKLTERRVKQSVLQAERKIKPVVKKVINTIKEKVSVVIPPAVKEKVSVVRRDTFPLKAVIVGMVGIGAAVLIYMRRKKR